MAIMRSPMSVLLTATAFSGWIALAGTVNVDLSSYANGSWCDVGGGPLVNCNTMPSGMQTFNGQTFEIAGANGGNNAWFSSVAANNGPGTVSLTIPINVANVTNVYTLLNTMWGQSGPSTYDTITFANSAGQTYAVALMGNYAIRDYNQYIWTNSISSSAQSVLAWNNYGSGEWQRLDEQVFALPTALFANQMLQSITITDTGSDTFSRIFLTGLTLETAADAPVPEPAALLLAAGGLIAIGILGRHKAGL